ncbi:hypothetical protein LCGC14_1944450 [marine sediment metagenome]|uniref:Uncharacterized protein n=1 Tax=marine sediment metagenome TaxID=412755 RepID=A0A0F9IGF9_9ZZZZ
MKAKDVDNFVEKTAKDIESQAYPEYEGCNSQQLARFMHDVHKELDRITEEKSSAQKRFDHLRMTKLPDTMENEGLESFKLEGVGRITLTSDIWVRIPSKSRERAYTWLRDNQFSDIIVGTINAGSLKATMKGLLAKGAKIPEDLFTCTPFTRASITRSS